MSFQCPSSSNILSPTEQLRPLAQRFLEIYIISRIDSKAIRTRFTSALSVPGRNEKNKKKGGEEVVKRITGMINSRVAVAEARSGGGCREDDKGTNYYNYPRTITTLNCIPSGNAGECLEENLLSLRL